MNEETAPEGMRLYSIVSMRKYVEPDGVMLEAVADDGTTIWLGNFAPDRYEVLVEGPNEPGGRRLYKGGSGSPAHERFEKYLLGYELFSEP